MKPNVVIGIVFVGVLVVCGVGWLIVPSLQDPQRGVNAEAAERVERARRLLHRYSIDLTHKSLLLDQLLKADIDVDIEDPEALADALADEYQEEHETAWDAYQPIDWVDGPREARARYGNIVQQIRDGIEARTALLAENEQWLEEALDAVGEALSITDGEVNSRAHPEANRLKGIIQFHMGLARWMHADARRQEAEPYRRVLLTQAGRVAELHSAQTLVVDSGIDERIQSLGEEVAQVDDALRERRRALVALDESIAGLEDRFSAAQSRANQAEAGLNQLKADGVDFSDPHGVDAFARAFAEQDRIYREAQREIQSLQAGSYPHAQIDRSGDFLTGRYVENDSPENLTIEHGLTFYRNERSVLAAQIRVEEEALEDLGSAVGRLEGMKAGFQIEQDRAAQQVPDAIAAAAETYDELNRIESEAFAIEEEALGLFDQAARVSKQAANYARDAVNNARERTRNLSPQAKGRSAFSEREGDAWIGGHIAAQVADARLAKAWVYHQQYTAHARTAAVLAEVAEPLQLLEADVESEQAKVQQAHDAGVEEINLAVAELEKAHRDVGQHWTIVAQEAGTIYLLALFGHPDYADDALEAYRTAVQGREEQASAAPFVARLERLESR